MDVTVIICSYNRCQSLAKTLESVAASTFDDGREWEVLVIDNNSKDKTREVAEEFCRRYPDHFRYLFEPRQGKSNALNLGIGEARGEVLAFTDDDVTVEPTWLQNLTANLHSGEWAGAGGRICAQRDVAPPEWLSMEGESSMAGLLALFDRGTEAKELIKDPPFGASMAFRKEMFEKYGGFRTDLGPPPKIRGEDTEFCVRVTRAGEHIRYEPTAVSYHAIPDERLKKKYFLTWHFGHGRCTARIRERRPPIHGIPSDYMSVGNRVFRMIPRGLWRWAMAPDKKTRFSNMCWVWMAAGEALEFLHQPGSAGGQPQDSNPEPGRSV